MLVEGCSGTLMLEPVLSGDSGSDWAHIILESIQRVNLGIETPETFIPILNIYQEQMFSNSKRNSKSFSP